MKEQILQQLGELYITYKEPILIALGWMLSLAPDYWLGNSKHKSFIGFLKYLNAQRKSKKEVK